MKDAINVRWTGDMAFEAAIRDHRILMDAKVETGGHNKGPRPNSLIMASLGGCTGMDVISILRKMKIEVQEFNVRVEAVRADDHPKIYLSLHVIYEFRGDELPLDKLTHAIELSQDKYCGVSATLQRAMPVTWEIKVL